MTYLVSLSDFFVLSELLTFSLSVVQEVNHFNPNEKKKELTVFLR
jgi:hypothetical protein